MWKSCKILLLFSYTLHSSPQDTYISHTYVWEMKIATRAVPEQIYFCFHAVMVA